MTKRSDQQKIALRYFAQTVGLCFTLSLCFGGLYAYVQSQTESTMIHLGFGLLSVLTMAACLSAHAHWLLIQPLHNLRNNLESELDLRRHQLESRMGASFQQNKLNALGEMAAGIAHEINNPLAILVGRTEQLRDLLSRESHIPPKQDSILMSMEKTLFRIQEAVLDLELIASSPKHEEIRAFPLSRLVKRLNKVVGNRYQTKEIAFDTEIENDVEIEGREVELSQAILYLLENASEAAQTSDHKWVRVSLSKNTDRSCTISITDSGIGVEVSLRPKLFQPFFSTKAEGRGMGLTLAKSVIDSHGGSVNFDFTSAHTTLTIHLPYSQEQSVSAA